MEIALQRDTGAQHQMSVHAHARIVLDFGQTEDLSPHLASLFELGPVVVEAREAAEDRKELRKLTLPLEELQRAGVRFLHFPRVALNGHQRSGQAGPQHDLLHRALRSRR